jgi:hypothetical protein
LCGEEILAVAIKCKHCGSYLQASEARRSAFSWTQRLVSRRGITLVGILAVVVGVGVVTWKPLVSYVALRQVLAGISDQSEACRRASEKAVEMLADDGDDGEIVVMSRLSAKQVAACQALTALAERTARAVHSGEVDFGRGSRLDVEGRSALGDESLTAARGARSRGWQLVEATLYPDVKSEARNKLGLAEGEENQLRDVFLRIRVGPATPSKACYQDMACLELAAERMREGKYARARGRFLDACNMGKAVGCGAAGQISALGLGGTPDWTQARQLFKKACDMGATDACANLKALSFEPASTEKRDSCVTANMRTLGVCVNAVSNARDVAEETRMAAWNVCLNGLVVYVQDCLDGKPESSWGHGEKN